MRDINDTRTKTEGLISALTQLKIASATKSDQTQKLAIQNAEVKKINTKIGVVKIKWFEIGPGLGHHSDGDLVEWHCRVPEMSKQLSV